LDPDPEPEPKAKLRYCDAARDERRPVAPVVVERARFVRELESGNPSPRLDEDEEEVGRKFGVRALGLVLAPPLLSLASR
jgi:hypothetical protein